MLFQCCSCSYIGICQGSYKSPLGTSSKHESKLELSHVYIENIRAISKALWHILACLNLASSVCMA